MSMDLLPENSRTIVLATPPQGSPAATDFAMVQFPLPPVAPEQVLVQVDSLSLDPYLRSLIGPGHLEEGPVRRGEVMPGRALGTVLASRAPSIPVGARVLAETGWRDYAVLDADGVTSLQIPQGVPATAALGLLGMPGLTAYAAHVRHLLPRPGETVVVSSATGGVGSLAGPLARLAGARTVGIVGSEAKVELARSLGYDQVVVRTSPDFAEQLHLACPDRVDAYLHMGDQATLDVVVEQLAPGARVSLCGLIDQSNGAPPTRLRAGALMAARAVTHGMVVYDHADLADEHRARVTELLRSDQIRLVEARYSGLDSARAAFADLMSGRNHGKVVVDVIEGVQR